MATSLSVKGLNEVETKELVDDVFKSNIIVLEDLDAMRYINLLRQKGLFDVDHAEEIEREVTSRKRATALVEKLRKTGEPLKVLTVLIDVITQKGFQPHIARKLIQSFDEKKKAMLQSKGASVNDAAMNQPLPGQHNGQPSMNPTSFSLYTSNRTTNISYGSTPSPVSAVESVGFDSETQRMVVPRGPYSTVGTGGSVPPSGINGSFYPPPLVDSGSLPPPPSSDNTSAYNADLDSNVDGDDVLEGPLPPSAGPLYEDREDGHGPYPHRPHPLTGGGNGLSSWEYQDPEYGPKPPRPPPQAVFNRDPPSTAPHEGEFQPLNNSLEASNIGRGSLQQGIPPRQMENSGESAGSGSSGWTSARLDQLSSQCQLLEKRLDSALTENTKLRDENRKLRVDNARLQKQLDGLLHKETQ